MSVKSLYDKDFYAWSLHQANMVRLGCWGELDIENLIEELDSMGRQQKHNLVSFLKQLIMHLLKWKYQKEKRTKSWQNSIENQREEIEYILSENPSLKGCYDECVENAYKYAVKLAARETGLSVNTFPEEIPFKTLLREDWFPE